MPVAAVPSGYTGQSALQAVQNYVSEYQQPLPNVTLSFLNKGLEEVSRRTGAPKLWYGYPTVVNQTTVQLNTDVLSIDSANFSMGNANSQNTGSASPFAQGTLVYPMTQLDQASFMDAAAGFPAVGFGPPQAFFIYQDAGQAPSSPIPPPSAPILTVVTTQNFLEWNINDWNQNVWSGPIPTVTVEVGVTYVNATGETQLSTVSDATI